MLSKGRIAVTLRIKNNTIMSFAFGLTLLAFNGSPAVSYEACSTPLPTGEWSCYRSPVPGWTPCVCTHTPGEPLCFWSSEPTCSPCDPSSICHVAKPCEFCNMHQGCEVWPNTPKKCSSPTTSSRKFETLSERFGY